ncbi:hypothetical protein BD289DRAFT_509603, partial [Coniella lustricola]
MDTCITPLFPRGWVDVDELGALHRAGLGQAWALLDFAFLFLGFCLVGQTQSSSLTRVGDLSWLVRTTPRVGRSTLDGYVIMA